MPALILALFGLVVGIFVEGLVSSYHYEGSFTPWPRCRACGRPAPLMVLVPLAGFLVSRRCDGCGRAQWLRATQIQVVTCLAFYALGVQYWGQPVLLAVSLAEAALLVAVLFIDAELRLIPTLLVALLVALALASAAVWPGLGLQSSLLGGVLAFATFGALVILANVVFGEGALGMGDANLALAIGCITGFPLVVFALATGVFLGGLGAVAVLLVGRGMRSTMPYGPYLVLAALYVLARGNTLNPAVHF